jgi:hypothetical protein
MPLRPRFPILSNVGPRARTTARTQALFAATIAAGEQQEAAREFRAAYLEKV